MPSEHPATNLESASDGGTAPDATPTGTAPRGPILPWALAAGLIAFLASWLVGEAAHGYFRPTIVHPPGWEDMNPYAKSDYISRETRQKRLPAEMKNTALAFGFLGAALGGSLGLAGGLVRRSPKGGLLGGARGAVIGLAAGAGASALMTSVFFRLLDDQGNLMVPLLTHCVIAATVGAAGGLGFGAGLGDRRCIARAALGGLVGAALGGLVFEMINAVAFPLVRVSEPVPDGRTPRLLLHLCVSMIAAVGIALGARVPGKELSKPTAPA